MKVKIKKPVIRIARGKTQFPLRAIDHERFLVGAGSSCQLQLSAADIPMIHSVISPTSQGHRIESLSPCPELFVNGAVTREALLQPGDEFSIGGYRFEYLIGEYEHEFRTTDGQRDQASKPGVTGSIYPNQIEPEDLEELSAADLVARLEQELELLDELGQYDDIPLDDFLGDQPGPNRLSA